MFVFGGGVWRKNDGTKVKTKNHCKVKMLIDKGKDKEEKEEDDCK